MAERTQAEMLAAQDQAQREFAYGIPGVEEEGTLPSQLLSYLTPFRTEVLQPPVTEFGEPRTQLNPVTNQLEEIVDRTVTPGVYGESEFGLGYTPIVRGIGSLIDYGQELIDSPEARSQAADAVSRVPEQMKRQLVGGADALERGRFETVDPKTGETFSGFEPFLAATGPMAVGRAVSDVPRNSFGIFGSGKGKSGKQAEDTVSMLEEAGLDPSEGWEKQSGANTYKSYRSSLDNKVRYEIPTSNVAFKQAFRETEDPDVELGKLLDPETRTEERLLAMQGMRIRKINDREYLTIPGFFDLDENQLNKYGFTRFEYKAGTGGLQKFPAPVLEQIVDFPQLFDEYPQLRSIRIEPTPPMALFVNGSYNPETKTIQLAHGKNTPEGRKEMMSTLMHEVQHAVQDIEGLYGGANTGMFEPTGFAGRKKKNRDSLKAVEANIEDALDDLVINTDDASKPTMFSDFLDFSKRAARNLTGGPKLTDALKKAPENKVRRVKYITQSYLKERAEEAEVEAKGEFSKPQLARLELNDAIEKRKAQLRSMNRPQEEIDAVDAQYRGEGFRYDGSDRIMIRLNDALKEAGVKNNESVAEKIAGAFDEQIETLRPILREREDIEEVQSQAFQMYSGNPGEVEARNVQRRFEGIKKDDPVRAPSGELTGFPETLSAEELQRVFPEDTQQMVLPESGLVYSMREGRKNEPSFSIDDPNDPQMELPGMGPPKPLPKDPAERLIARRDYLRGALDQDDFRYSKERVAVARELAQKEREIEQLRAAAGYPTDRDYAQGGEVNQMRKPVISSGLSGLLRGYTQGPLARVSRETQEPVGMFAGGMMGGFEPKIDMSNFDFSKLPAYAIPAAAAAAVEQAQERATPPPPPPPPPTQTTSGPPTGTSPAGPSEAERAAAYQQAMEETAALQAEVDRANALAAQQEAERLASEQLAAQEAAQQAAQQTAAAPTTMAAAPTTMAAAPTTMAATTAAAPVMPTTQELIAQQRALEQAALMGNLVSAPGQTPNEPGMFLREGTDVLLSPLVPTGGGTTGGGTTAETPVADATPDDTPVYTEPPPDSGPGPGPGDTGGGTTGGGTTGGGTTGGGTTTGGTTTGGGTTGGGTTTTTGPVYLPPVETPPVQAGPTAAEVLAAEQAAADALAAQEAEELRIAQAEADRLAAEREALRIANEQAAADALAAQEAERLAIEQAAAVEAQRLASELLAAQEAEKALIAEQLAAEQLAAEQLAAQQAAQLVADQEAAAQLQAAEQLAAQQAADRVAMEAQIAATPDPDPIYEAPTQGELLQAAETAQAAEAPLFTTPTETDTAIDRGAYGRPTGLGLAGIQTLLNQVDLDVADTISPYTTGFPTTQGMDIQRTYMPFEGTEEERATGYTMPVYKPVAQQAVPSLFSTTDFTDIDPDAFTAGSAAPGENSGIINTGTQSTAPGTFGLEPTQMYRCGNGYTLQFVNGKPVCVRTGGGGPGKPPRKDPEIVDIANPGGMRYGGDVGLNRGIGSFGA